MLTTYIVPDLQSNNNNFNTLYLQCDGATPPFARVLQDYIGEVLYSKAIGR